MIDTLTPYPAYKDSGLPWLGQVPEHWEIKRGKSYMIAIDERSSTGQEELLTVSSSRGVVPRSTANVTMFKAKSYTGYKLCWPGDLVINSLWAWGGGLGVSSYHGIISTAYSVYRMRSTSRINPNYLHELVRSSAFNWELQVRSKGIWISRLQLTDNAFLDTPIPLPPPADQAAIVRFLEWAGGRLERAIRAKRRIIALLNEQKQAIIHRAVTRGLDPNVPLKDSGIPWLGEIPAHWEVSRIKNEFSCLNTQRVPLNSTERGAMTTRTYDYYGASGVIDKVNDYIFDDELLLIAEDGANLVLRNLPLAIIAKGRFWVNNHAHILKPKRGSIVYLAHVLETLNYKPWISGAAQPKLTQDRLLCISIAVAPPAEQTLIVEVTSEQTRPLTTTISRLEREIALLREYRTRLVADVVTGKLDVRAAAASLPDEVATDDSTGTDAAFDDEGVEDDSATEEDV
jgi:type I restriction enzyme S subunit